MPRFVVLYHELPPESQRPSHYDLMLECEGRLATWTLADEPQLGVLLPAERIADHRLAYLDYEGPVSQNRGAVSCWDRGEYRTLERTDSLWTVELMGEKHRLQAVLSVCSSQPEVGQPEVGQPEVGQPEAGHPPQRWTVRFSPLQDRPLDQRSGNAN